MTSEGDAVRRVVLATRNRDKVTEIRAVLSVLPITLVLVDEWGELPEVEETGSTLEANAILKAATIARLTGEPALADDTGLEVDALDGAPGVYSSRFAGADATYAQNVARLLDVMADVPAPERTARFRAVMAFVDPRSGTTRTVDGVSEGVILSEARGEGGFGYDPVFRPLDAERTFAEMSLDEKNRQSHRARALRAVVPLLEAWLSARA